jgi:hypothetical protein
MFKVEELVVGLWAKGGGINKGLRFKSWDLFMTS